jgi:hypothetical protein
MNCDILNTFTQLILCQVVELLEAFTGWDTNNKYAIKNSMGQQIFYAFEETGWCMRCCCGPRRGFLLHIVDNYNKVVKNYKKYVISFYYFALL